MEAHHYLSYTQPVGEHLKHLVYARSTPVRASPGRRLRGIWSHATASSVGPKSSDKQALVHRV